MAILQSCNAMESPDAGRGESMAFTIDSIHDSVKKYPLTYRLYCANTAAEVSDKLAKSIPTEKIEDSASNAGKTISFSSDEVKKLTDGSTCVLDVYTSDTGAHNLFQWNLVDAKGSPIKGVFYVTSAGTIKDRKASLTVYSTFTATTPPTAPPATTPPTAPPATTPPTAPPNTIQPTGVAQLQGRYAACFQLPSAPTTGSLRITITVTAPFPNLKATYQVSRYDTSLNCSGGSTGETAKSGSLNVKKDSRQDQFDQWEFFTNNSTEYRLVKILDQGKTLILGGSDWLAQPPAADFKITEQKPLTRQ
jgi:hypothetical protein